MVPPIFYRRVMGKIYYIVEAYIGSMAQGTDLALVKARDGEIYGCSFEFDLCTREISLASGPFVLIATLIARSCGVIIRMRLELFLRVGRK